jgi:hypothetical protein
MTVHAQCTVMQTEACSKNTIHCDRPNSNLLTSNWCQASPMLSAALEALYVMNPPAIRARPGGREGGSADPGEMGAAGPAAGVVAGA